MAPPNPKYNTPLVPAASATLIIHARYSCAAPAALVFRVLRNAETWKDWNRFVPRVTIRFQPDDDEEHAAMEHWLETGRFASPEAADAEVRRRSSQVAAAAKFKPPNLLVDDADEHTDVGAAMAALGVADDDHPFPTPSPGPSNPSKRSSSIAPNTNSATAAADATRRASASAASKTARTMRKHFGGEPSSRLKQGTVMTFHVCMKLPRSPHEYTDAHLLVTEVSRPNDPVNDDSNLTAVPTHLDAGTSGVYRISWASDPKKGYPKFMLQAQRVHEVRPVTKVDGAGREQEGCEIETWECQRGMLAKAVKRMYAGYLQERFEEWVKGLAEYCEGIMPGGVTTTDWGAVDAPKTGIVACP